VKPVLDFPTLYTEYHPRPPALPDRLVGDYDAEDLTRKFFIRISQALPSFRGESRLSTWIYRIATNAALDRLRSPAYQRTRRTTSRRNRRRRRKSRMKLPGWGMRQLRRSISSGVKSATNATGTTIANLPINYRTVVALSELEDLAASEIAEILRFESGCGENSLTPRPSQAAAGAPNPL